MKTSTFRYKDSITGPAWSGITLVGSSSSSATFPGGNFPPADRLLFLGAPSLHIHPATDTVLHDPAPKIDWTLVGIDERWRDGLRVIFRKRTTVQNPTQRHRGTSFTKSLHNLRRVDLL